MNFTTINSVLTCNYTSLALLLETNQNTSLSNSKLNSKTRYDRPLLQVSIIDLDLATDKVYKGYKTKFQKSVCVSTCPHTTLNYKEKQVQGCNQMMSFVLKGKVNKAVKAMLTNEKIMISSNHVLRFSVFGDIGSIHHESCLHESILELLSLCKYRLSYSHDENLLSEYKSYFMRSIESFSQFKNLDTEIDRFYFSGNKEERRKIVKHCKDNDVKYITCPFSSNTFKSCIDCLLCDGQKVNILCIDHDQELKSLLKDEEKNRLTKKGFKQLQKLIEKMSKDDD
jgi:hypothetical protein